MLQALAAIRAEMLGVERVGRHDNFFELGGHSLLAVKIIHLASQRELDLDMRTLFATATLQALALATRLAREEWGRSNGRARLARCSKPSMNVHPS